MSPTELLQGDGWQVRMLHWHNVITDRIGSDWITDMSKLQGLEDSLYDSSLLEQITNTKTLGKHKLSQYIQKTLGVSVDPSSMFDVQVKRIHEYKRQHLLALWIVSRYVYIKNHKDDYVVPRTVMAKQHQVIGWRNSSLDLFALLLRLLIVILIWTEN